MKLGFVAEPDRLPDSPDTIRAQEPSVGAVMRSKGQLYVLVTCRVAGNKAREATRLVADTIEHEYYYDESAGIRVCLEKAIRAANKKLAHTGDRFGLGRAEDGNGPVGVAAAVVRSNELYVATVGPAEAYLIRQARLSTLPDPHRERGLPSEGLEPEVWRGEMTVGDSLVLASPDLVAKLGVDELKDALVTLHPQSAMEHLHHRFVAADGTGSDGALAVEATEVSSTARQRALVPVRPSEPLAGAPDRSPIPLADSVGDGVAAVSATAGRARSAAGGVVGRAFRRLQDLLPARSGAPRRVNPATSRARTQRRAAMAAFVLVIVVTALGLLVVYFPGGHDTTTRPSQVLAADAVQTIKDDLAKISGPGFDLIRDDRPKALALLNDAYARLRDARTNGVPDTILAPLRAQVIRGLETIFSVVPVASTSAFVFPADKTTPDLIALVRGPVDGLPYVLDRASKTVYRVDPKAKKAYVVLQAGKGGAAEPRFLAVGGRDVLILDSKNTLWRFRPADATRGTLKKVTVNGSASWGTDVRGIGTFQPGTSVSGLYRLYVIRPGDQQIEMYAPSADGSVYPGSPSKRLAGPQKLDDVDAMLIDGDIYLAQAGKVSLVLGRTSWKMGPIGDDTLHPTTDFTAIATSSHSVGTGAALRILDDDLGSGTIYAYDHDSGRIVAFGKDEGKYQVQYRLANGDASWGSLRGFYILPGGGAAPPSVVWIGTGGIGIAPLVAVPDTITGTVASPSPSASPPASPKVTPRPTKKPTPTKKP
jgi:hypothetical protein